MLQPSQEFRDGNVVGGCPDTSFSGAISVERLRSTAYHED